MKLIKRRIASIKGTKQIMKAMNLVAAAKLQKAKQRLDAVRPMFADIQTLMDSVKACEGVEENVYFRERKVKRSAYVLITSDRGLCGGYNVNLAKEAIEFMRVKGGTDEFIVAAGARGMAYVRRRGKNVQAKFDAPSEAGSIGDAKKIGNLLCNMFLKEEIDEAYVVYTKFKSVLAHIPYVAKILPIGSEQDSATGNTGYKKQMIFDPDIGGFLKDAVPMYINTFINGAMIESSVCEWASRMTSMDAATNNAADILEKLTLDYNRTRQGIITQEITEIVSGANALK
jgi:F-type H+-transporting ATPase subunit gamma